ncbi:MAG TPA: DHHA1 domain-containing protein, partial [Flavobacteriales bacterium]|nr:DHHA1 domain-containing protein [Flavobacteriales bacterium]
KGSLVAPDRLRFDISHFAKITPEELAAVEADVNAQIRADEQLKEQREVSMAEAQAQGAMALFGEKYGDRVRTIRFGDSIELCGGTHVAHTGDIGQLRIVGESALAAGIRRLEAITGAAADAWVNERLEQLEAIKDRLKQPQDPVAAVEQLLSRNTALEKEVEQAAKERVAALSKDILNDARAVNGARLLAKEVDLDAQGMKDLAFRLKDANPDLLMVLGGRHDGKALLTVLVGQQLIDERGLKATDVVKQLASEIKGGGGGQPFLATAGGKDPDGIPRALAKAAALLD